VPIPNHKALRVGTLAGIVLYPNSTRHFGRCRLTSQRRVVVACAIEGTNSPARGITRTPAMIISWVAAHHTGALPQGGVGPDDACTTA
jgi:hypothetical protein